MAIPIGFTFTTGDMRLSLIYFAIILLSVASCTSREPRDVVTTDSYPDIFPEYKGVTIPANIAPLNFRVAGGPDKVVAIITGEKGSVKVVSSDDRVLIPARKWQRLLEDNTGRSLKFEVTALIDNRWTEYRPFRLFIAGEPIDGYLVYRNLMPGFQNWNSMGIYQRDLSSFDVETVIDSRLLPGTCMNCHSFAMNDPGNMVLHLRESYGGTILHRNGVTEKINARAGKMFAAAAFPSWHPSGRYIAFSVNRVNQIFHATGTRRATALDLKSDIVLYNTDSHEMKIPDQLSRSDRFETFPCFSPDGKRLYFCSADSVSMPAGFDSVSYSIYSLAFDEEKGEFGTEADTLVSADARGKSCSIPRVSPDGNFLMFTVSDYGAFPSYNPESDIRIMDLGNSNCFPADSLNSPDADSWHSWSSNSRWVVVSSRRMDGLYSNPYIAYIDADGIARKPFLLPQKDPGFYDSFLYSFNVPEFAVKPVQVSPYEIERLAKRTPPAPVQAGSSH